MKNTEERILNAAMNVFAREGYAGATTRKIAQEAGVNEVTLFRKFRSKENILKMVIAKNQEDALKKLDSILFMEKDADISTCLQTLGYSIMQFMEERVDFIIMLIAEGRQRPEITEFLSTFPQKMIEHLDEYFQERIEKGHMRNVNTKVVTLAYIGYIFYSNVIWKKFSEKMLEDKEEAFKDYIDVFTRGIINVEDET